MQITIVAILLLASAVLAEDNDDIDLSNYQFPMSDTMDLSSILGDASSSSSSAAEFPSLANVELLMNLEKNMALLAAKLTSHRAAAASTKTAPSSQADLTVTQQPIRFTGVAPEAALPVLRHPARFTGVDPETALPVFQPPTRFAPFHVLHSVAPLVTATQYHSQDELGQAQFGYSFPGQAAVNHRDAWGNQVGSWAYINPDGKEVRVSYVADSQGFRVLSNDYPVAPVDPGHLRPLQPIQDTPEVSEAKAAHFAAVAAAANIADPIQGAVPEVIDVLTVPAAKLSFLPAPFPIVRSQRLNQEHRPTQLVEPPALAAAKLAYRNIAVKNTRSL